MTLYQFLRYVLDITPIAIFDISGNVICKVKSKKNLDFNLFDYTIFRVSVAKCSEYHDDDCYLCICIEK